MKLPCAECAKLHDISDLEPSLERPDAFLAVPEAEREARTRANENYCVVYGPGKSDPRWFVRVLVPVPVHGAEEPCHWGVWSEVSSADYARITLLYGDPEQSSHPPFSAVLANDLHGYPPTAGLPGKVSFRDVNSFPFFEFDQDVTHEFAEETRTGVPPERLLEWFAPLLHASP